MKYLSTHVADPSNADERVALGAELLPKRANAFFSLHDARPDCLATPLACAKVSNLDVALSIRFSTPLHELPAPASPLIG